MVLSVPFEALLVEVVEVVEVVVIVDGRVPGLPFVVGARMIHCFRQ